MNYLRTCLAKMYLISSLILGGNQTFADQRHTNEIIGEAVKENIVLVCVKECDDLMLSPMRLRKLFLGMPVQGKRHYLKPLVNVSDQQLENVFYQSVVAMSRKSFQAKTLMQQLRFAFAVPKQFDDQSLLFSELEKLPTGVTYMWQRDADKIKNIRVIRTLWQGVYAGN